MAEFASALRHALPVDAPAPGSFPATRRRTRPRPPPPASGPRGVALVAMLFVVVLAASFAASYAVVRWLL